MALKIKHKGQDNYVVLHSAFNVPTHVIDLLKGQAVAVEFGGSEIIFKSGNEVLADLEVMPGTLSAAMAGTMKAAEAKVIQEIVLKAAKKAIKAAEGKPAAVSEADLPDFGGQFSKAKMEVPVVAAPVNAAILGNAPVPLKSATQLYEPVHATSAGSVYHVVALNADLRIAARLKSGMLSLRAEGNIQKHKSALVAGGFDADHFPEYCSVHLAVGDNQVMAARTLGSFLAGLNIAFDTPVPVLSVFALHGK